MPSRFARSTQPSAETERPSAGYIALAKADGLTQETVLERKEEVLLRLQMTVERLHSKATKQDLLKEHIGEILDPVKSPERLISDIRESQDTK